MNIKTPLISIQTCFMHLGIRTVQSNSSVQRVPALRAFWDLEKTKLHESRVSGTEGGPLLTQKSPTH